MEFLTCLRGHRIAREKWARSTIDPACLLCPVCSEVVDDSKPARRSGEGVEVIPVGRRACHLVGLIRKLEGWIESRRQIGLDAKPLREAVAMLTEYQNLLTSIDIDTATGADLDRLLDPIPRERGLTRIETDEAYRARAKCFRFKRSSHG